MPEIARLEPVELRDVWPNEATDFTPWLLRHLDALGDQIGLELEPLQREASVGRYSLDILANDINGNRSVVIENQLEATDHNHLGKVLTYAAGYDADVMVWVVREFLDEHRQALDWLNQRTGLDTEFYGVEVRAVKIGDSLPAPIFEVVARPNEFRKRNVNIADRPITVADRAYQQFFQGVADRLADVYGHHRRSAGPRSWMDYMVPTRATAQAYGVFDLLGDGVAAPATLLVDSDGIVAAQVGQSIGDRPSATAILDALRLYNGGELRGRRVGVGLMADAAGQGWTWPAVTPEEARDRAADALRGLASAHFSRMTHEDGASADMGFAALTEAEGDAVFPDRAKFTAQVVPALFRNATLDLDVVRIGETVYLRDGVSGQWQTLPAGTFGIDFSNIASAVADAVDSMRSVELADGGSVGGADTLRLAGAAPAEALRGFVPSAPEGGTLQVTLWAGREDFLIRKVEVTGVLFPNDPPDITRTLELSRFGEPVAVEPPG